MNKEQFLENESSLYCQLAKIKEVRGKNGIFLPEVGSEYQVGKGLMICGRAARWSQDDYIYDEYDTPSMAQAQVERIFGAEEQIEWAEKSRGCREGYNTARSPFWRVIREVSSSPALYSEAWYKHIIYNNLYRVSADDRPTDSFCRKQRKFCSKLLVNEIEYFAPKAVLCLTGMCWAEEVLEEAGISVEVSRTIPWGNYAVSVVESDMTTFLISEHPQGKREKPHVDAILEGLEDIMMLR